MKKSGAVRMARDEYRNGLPTFIFDPVNNPVDIVLQRFAQETGEDVILSGADRSDKAAQDKLSEKNHNSQFARDISVRRNSKILKNPKLRKKLVSMLVENGLRVGDASDHIHVDSFPEGSGRNQVFIEPGKAGSKRYKGGKVYEDATSTIRTMTPKNMGQLKSKASENLKFHQGQKDRIAMNEELEGKGLRGL